MADLVIRRYRRQDLPMLTTLVRGLQRHERRYFDRMKPPEALGSDYVRRLLADCREHEGVLLVAEADERLLGYAAVLARVSTAEDIDEALYHYAFIADLFVSEEARQRGIGKALLAACEEVAAEAGVEWLRLSVLAANALAQSFYRHAGFQPVLLTLEKPVSGT